MVGARQIEVRYSMPIFGKHSTKKFNNIPFIGIGLKGILGIQEMKSQIG
jgi:hypothetical protein